ncbi:hypothetical protein ACJX0J_019395, partial [Zea mays]
MGFRRKIVFYLEKGNQRHNNEKDLVRSLKEFLIIQTIIIKNSHTATFAKRKFDLLALHYKKENGAAAFPALRLINTFKIFKKILKIFVY